MANGVENPDSYGAIGNGTTNDTLAFQNAINTLVAYGGGILQLSPKKYYLGPSAGDPTRGIVINGASIRVVGAGWEEAPRWNETPTSPPTHGPTYGSWLLADTSSYVPVTIGDPAGSSANTLRCRGTVFSGIAVQNTGYLPPVTGSWTPADPPPFFDVQNTQGEITFTDLYFPIVNRLVRSYFAGRLNFAGQMRGLVLRSFADIDRAEDATWADDIELWPFSTTLASALDWQQANAEGFVLKRTDALMLGRMFVYGMRAAIHTMTSAYGSPSKLEINSLLADFSTYGLLIASSGCTMDIGNLNVQCQKWNTAIALPGSAAIQATQSNARIKISNLQVQRTEAEAIRLGGTDNRIEIGAALFEYANQGNNGSGGGNPAGTGIYTSTSPTNILIFESDPLIANSNNASLVSSTAATGVQAWKSQLIGIPVGGTSAPTANMLGDGSYFLATSGPRMYFATDYAAATNTYRTTLSVDAVDPAQDTRLLVRGQAGSVLLFAERPSGSANLEITAGGSAGSVRLGNSAGVVLRTETAAGGDANFLFRRDPAAASLVAEGPANVDMVLTAKGTTGSVRLKVSNATYPDGYTILRTDNPNSGNTTLLIRSEANNVLLFAEGTAATDLTMGAFGSIGSVRLQANSMTVLRADNLSSGDTSLLVRRSTGNVLVIPESGSANGRLTLTGKGVGGTLIESSTSGTVGFFGTAPATKPTVTGSRGGNAALQSLLTALGNLGLINDGTTA